MHSSPPPLRHDVGSVATEFVTDFGTEQVALASLAVCLVVLVTVSCGRFRRPERAREALLLRLGAVTVALVVLMIHVYIGGWLASADPATTRWFVDHRNGVATTLAEFVTTLGGPVPIGAFTVVAAVVLWRRTGSRARGIALFAGVAGASTVAALAKELVARPRPPEHVRMMADADFSFPSGHVSATAALVLTLLVVAPAATAAKRRAAGVLAAMVVLAVAVTRIYLGVHWLTDVIAGALIGAAAAIVVAVVLERLSWRGAGTTALPRPNSDVSRMREQLASSRSARAYVRR